MGQLLQVIEDVLQADRKQREKREKQTSETTENNVESKDDTEAKE